MPMKHWSSATGAGKCAIATFLLLSVYIPDESIAFAGLEGQLPKTGFTVLVCRQTNDKDMRSGLIYSTLNRVIPTQMCDSIASSAAKCCWQLC